MRTPCSKKNVLLSITALCLLLVIAVCGCARTGPVKEKTEGNGYTVTDDTGTKIHFNHKPKRIVSITLSSDEFLLDLVPPDRIAGLSSIVDRPEISNVTEKAKAVKGRIRDPNPEAIMALNPDLILTADFIKPEVITSMRDLGIPVYVYRTQSSYEEIRQSVRAIEKALGENGQAEKLVREMDEKLATVEKKLGNIPENQRPRIVFFRTYGAYCNPYSTFNDSCRYAQIRDATWELRYDRQTLLSEEQVVRLNPDIFMIADWNFDGYHVAQKIGQSIMSNPAYKNVNAVKNNRLIILPGRYLYCLSHYLANVPEVLARQVYPERFR